VSLSVERESMRRELETADRRRRDQTARLLDFIGFSSDRPPAEAAGLTPLGSALSQRIRERLQAITAMAEQSAAGKAALLEEMERFRLVNVFSISEGSRDLRADLDALAAAIERVPVKEGAPDGWLACWFRKCR
jgi:hypothetical protein